MICKNCNKVEISWPENYRKGDKPIESETGITHDMNRCKNLQNVNVQKSNKWKEYDCSICGNHVWCNPKYYKNNTCRDCRPVKYKLMGQKEIDEFQPHAYTSKAKRPTWLYNKVNI